MVFAVVMRAVVAASGKAWCCLGCCGFLMAAIADSMKASVRAEGVLPFRVAMAMFLRSAGEVPIARYRREPVLSAWAAIAGTMETPMPSLTSSSTVVSCVALQTTVDWLSRCSQNPSICLPRQCISWRLTRGSERSSPSVILSRLTEARSSAR